VQIVSQSNNKYGR